MPSVEAARNGAAAPRVQLDSAPKFVPESTSLGVSTASRSDFFAALFASARLAREQREASAERANKPGDEQDNAAKESTDEHDEADVQAAADGGGTHAWQARQSSSRDRVKETSRERGKPSFTGRASGTHAREDVPGQTAAESPASDETAGASETPADGGTEHDPAPAQQGRTTDPAAATSAPGNPSINAANGTRSASGVETAPTSAAVSGSGSPLPAGSTGDSPAASGIAGAVVALQPAGLRGLAGTESASATPAARQNAAGGSGSEGEGAKSAASGGSFDHLLQAAAHTKGQIAGAGMEKPIEAGPTLRPSELESVSQLARVIRSVGREGQSKMVLQLDPPELGQVRIDVRMHEQMLSVRMEAQTQAGHDALQSRLTELRSALEQQGVQVQNIEVELRPPPTGHSPQEQSWNQQSASQHDAPGNEQPPQQGAGGREGSQTEGGAPGGGYAGSEAGGLDSVGAAVAAPWYSRQLNLVA